MNPCGCSSCKSKGVTAAISNRPGLSALSYRIGTYDSFFAAMKARLSDASLSNPPAVPPLRSLKTRDQDDPAIALLDIWAVLADVLTFYQERIANEGYLRTAIERQSIVALSALVGAALRPGVSASTYLAYTVDPTGTSLIAAGSKVQSIPGPGELPQTFETSQSLNGTGSFSGLSPRLTRPQILTPDASTLFLSGLTNNVNPNDSLLIDIGSPTAVRIASIALDTVHNRTSITLQPSQQDAPAGTLHAAADVLRQKTDLTPEMSPLGALLSFVGPLEKAPAKHPPTALDLVRRSADVFNPGMDTAPKIVRELNAGAGDSLYTALAQAQVAPTNAGNLFAFRVKAPVYGHNAQLKPITDAHGIVIGTEEWPLAGSTTVLISIDLTEEQIGSQFFRRGASTSDAQKAYISIAQAGSTAVGMLAIPSTGMKVGKWSVDIEGSFANKHVTIKLNELELLYDITINQNGSFRVVTDDPVVVVAPGQSIAADSNGRHLLVSLASSLVISDDSPSAPDQLNVIYLDTVYDKIVPGSWVYIVRADSDKRITPVQVSSVAQVSRSSYNMPSRVSQLTLAASQDPNAIPWLDPKTDRLLSVARNTTVYAQSELLPLAEEPIPDDVAGDTIELGALYSDLQPGRWLIVSGQRTDIPGTSGIEGSELVMLASVKQGVQQIEVPPATPSSSTTSIAASGMADQTGDATMYEASAVTASTTPVLQNRPGESTHSFLTLASPLAYTYERGTVTVYGNVVPATHGETRKEVLGSGDSSQTFQQFKLHGSPLTYTSDASASGVASSLAVYVNNIQWHEVDSLSDCGPSDRSYVTSVDDQNNVTVTFGDGEHGMRLPTGIENVRAVYRVGIGSGGNVDANKLTLLSTRPLGAKTVTNPLISSGGTDRDSAEAGRRNAPLATICLDRLVSVSDYASFARTFAGIGKATSTLLPIAQQRTVAVSVTGANGSVLAPTSQVVQQLTLAFQQLGDPALPINVQITDPMLLVISARIKILPDSLWTAVAPQVNAALITRFSFDLQIPGESVYLSEVINTIQQVQGVAYTVVDGFDTIRRSELASADALVHKFAELAASRRAPESLPMRLEYVDAQGNLHPSEIAFLSADVPDTLLLTEITS